MRRQLKVAVRPGMAWLRSSMGGGVPARPDCRVEESCAPPDDAGLPAGRCCTGTARLQGEWCERRTGTPDPVRPQKE